MKSIILDLDEDLTNKQIDSIIKKLQEKKVSRKDKIVLTKEEKDIIKQFEGEFNHSYSPENHDPNTYFKDVIEELNGDIDDWLVAIDDEINCCKENIEINKEDIKAAYDGIKEYQQEIVEHTKGKTKIKGMFKLVKQLEKSFKTKRSKK